MYFAQLLLYDLSDAVGLLVFYIQVIRVLFIPLRNRRIVEFAVLHIARLKETRTHCSIEDDVKEVNENKIISYI